MRIIGVSTSGQFDTQRVRDDEHWENVRDVWVYWIWEENGHQYREMQLLEKGFRWDGASRPNCVGWLVPRGGVFLLASAIHDMAFKERFKLADGSRITRKHADLLYLALMRHLAGQRVTSGWKEPAQVWLAGAMYRAVRVFGEPVWDKHDSEFREA